jgi:phospholipid-translocating P-type ATPase (flippase)
MQISQWPDHEQELLPAAQATEGQRETAVDTNTADEGPTRIVRTGRFQEEYIKDLQAQGKPVPTCCSNEITTSKYTINPFLPTFIVYRNLFEQFQRAANVYFVFIAILQIIPGISPTGRFTTIMPLAFVMFVSLLKDAFEDYKRHVLDDQLNNSIATIWKEGKGWTTVCWKDITVGNLMRIDKGQTFPADVIILSTSEAEGLCYIETSSLDGETNLKIRKSVAAAYAIFDGERPDKFHCICHHELPNNRLENFSGSMLVDGVRKVPLTAESVLLRGAALRNTGCAYGIVIFTGAETKLMKNASAKRHKMSNMDLVTNRQVFFIFGFQLCLCLVCAIGLGIYTASIDSHWYLSTHDPNVAATAALGFLTFLILFNNLIPISLYVSMEMVKLVQANLINSDAQMYHEETDTNALARTSSLNEELGQVSYVFSDKTGTLTCNIMDFLKFSCIDEEGRAISYGSGVTEIAKSAAARKGEVLVDKRPPGLVHKDGFCFWDERISDGRWANQRNAGRLEELFCHLAVCHTVVAEYERSGAESGQTAVYQAASPDEACLVKGARELGAVFVDRTEKDIDITCLNKKLRYQLLNIIEFDSTRKRMSVVVRDPSGQLLLLCKGADSVIFERLRKTKENEELLRQTSEMLTVFAEEGLRTLVIAKSVLDPTLYASWSKKYDDALCLTNGRAERVAAVGEELEWDLELIGTTAIEDKLQEGVPRTIELLIAAGVKVWVLTGDKQETAINIGFACALLNNTMNLMLFDTQTAENVAAKIEEFLNSAKKDGEKAGVGADLGLVIQGNLLHTILENDAIAASFLALARQCKSVVCCRVSPLQKAQIVLLVRESIAGSITLSIGDGANDVSMIQSAHVGIGISGLEGQQAARASDYSVAQFRYLQRLLLVHGRWSYRRISRLILYSFYKNITLYMTQLWFCFFNAFSGQTLTDQWALALYNVWFTAFPIMFVAVLDRDVREERILSTDQFPELYKDGLTNRLFNTRGFWMYIGNAVVHSALSFFVPLSCLYYSDADISTLGVTSYSSVLFVVTGKVALETLSWTWFNVGIISLSLGVWYSFLLVYTNLFKWVHISDFAFWYGVASNALTSPTYWLVLVLTMTIALLRDYMWKYVRRNFHPELSHVIQVLEDKCDGNFTRRSVPPKLHHLLSTLEDLAPKDAAHRFMETMQPKGYGFSQDPGQLAYIATVTKAVSKFKRPLKNKEGSPHREPQDPNYSDVHYQATGAAFVAPPEEIVYVNDKDI